MSVANVCYPSVKKTVEDFQFVTFLPSVSGKEERIPQDLVPPPQRQYILFSATLSLPQILNEPAVVAR